MELEKFGCYELMSRYEKKKIQKRKNGYCNVESKKSYNFTSEHPSHRYMALSEMKHFLIPCIGNTNLFPDVSKLEINSLETFDSDSDVYKARELYAQLVLLLFCPYQVQSDLLKNNCYRDRYIKACIKKEI